jgi:NitT/TauT family transport system ATP-binding protein
VPSLIAVEDVSRVYQWCQDSSRRWKRSRSRFRPNFVSIVGLSGCGKSDAAEDHFRFAAGVVGKGLVNGERVDQPLENVGMVFLPVLLKWRSVLGNILLPVEFAKLDLASHLQKAQALIKLVGLAGFEEMYPHELSGGMQQRASLCRALVTDPQLLLMDEPFGALDAMTRDELDIELLRIWEERKKTVLFVTHSIQEAVFLSDQVFVMSARPGRLLEKIKIDLPRPRTMEMMSHVNFGEYTLNIRALLASAGGAGGSGVGSTM